LKFERFIKAPYATSAPTFDFMAAVAFAIQG